MSEARERCWVSEVEGDFLIFLPDWKAFNQPVAKNGDVGIWQETCTIRPGSCRNIYGDMPAYGLGLAGPLRPAGGKH